jgi:hypothetical protein
MCARVSNKNFPVLDSVWPKSKLLKVRGALLATMVARRDDHSEALAIELEFRFESFQK